MVLCTPQDHVIGRMLRDLNLPKVQRECDALHTGIDLNAGKGCMLCLGKNILGCMEGCFKLLICVCGRGSTCVGQRKALRNQYCSLLPP